MCLIKLGQATTETAIKLESVPVPTALFQDSGDVSHRWWCNPLVC